MEDATQQLGRCLAGKWQDLTAPLLGCAGQGTTEGLARKDTLGLRGSGSPFPSSPLMTKFGSTPWYDCWVAATFA